MKKLALILISALLMLGFAGCKGEEINVAPAEMTGKILESFPSDIMAEVTSDRIQAYYDLDTGILDGMSVYIDGSGGFADELAIFKVKNSGDTDAVKKAIEKRLEERKELFRDYNPDEFAKLENSTVTVKGNYVLFVVSDDNSITEKAFGEFFK